MFYNADFKFAKAKNEMTFTVMYFYCILLSTTE